MAEPITVDWDRAIELLQSAIKSTGEKQEIFERNAFTDKVQTEKVTYIEQEEDEDSENEEDLEEQDGLGEQRGLLDLPKSVEVEATSQAAWRQYQPYTPNGMLYPHRPENPAPVLQVSPRKRTSYSSARPSKKEASPKKQRAPSSPVKEQNCYLGQMGDSMSSRIGSGFSSERLVCLHSRNLEKFVRRKRRRAKKNKSKRPQHSTLVDGDTGLPPQRLVFESPREIVPSDQRHRSMVALLKAYDFGVGGCDHVFPGIDTKCDITESQWVEDGNPRTLRKDGKTPAILFAVNRNVPCQVLEYNPETSLFKVQVEVERGTQILRAEKDYSRTTLRFLHESEECFRKRLLQADSLRLVHGRIWMYKEFLSVHPRPTKGYIGLGKGCFAALLKQKIIASSLDFCLRRIVESPYMGQHQQAYMDQSQELSTGGDQGSTSSLKQILGRMASLLEFEASDTDVIQAQSEELVSTIFTNRLLEEETTGPTQHLQGHSTVQDWVSGNGQKIANRLVGKAVELLSVELETTLQDHFHEASCAYNLSLSTKPKRELIRRRRKFERLWAGKPSWAKPQMLTYHCVKLEKWSVKTFYVDKSRRRQLWASRFTVKRDEVAFPFKERVVKMQLNHVSSFPKLAKAFGALHEMGLHIGSNFFSKTDDLDKVPEAAYLLNGIDQLTEVPMKPSKFVRQQLLQIETTAGLLSERWVASVVLLFAGGVHDEQGYNGETFNFYTKSLEEYENGPTSKLNKCIRLRMRDQMFSHVQENVSRLIDILEASSGWTTTCILETPKVLRVRLGKLDWHKRFSPNGLFVVKLEYTENGARFEPPLNSVMGSIIGLMPRLAEVLKTVVDPAVELTPFIHCLDLASTNLETSCSQSPPLLPIDLKHQITAKRKRVSDGEYVFQRIAPLFESSHGYPNMLGNYFWESKSRLEAILLESIMIGEQLISTIHKFEKAVLSGVNSKVEHIKKLDMKVYVTWFTKPLVKKPDTKTNRRRAQDAFFLALRDTDDEGTDSSSSIGTDSFGSDLPDEEAWLAPAPSLPLSKVSMREREFDTMEILPVDMLEMSERYDVIVSDMLEEKMFVRCSDEVYRLRGIIKDIEVEMIGAAQIPLFAVSYDNAVQDLVDSSQSLIDGLLNALYEDALESFKYALEEYNSIEERLRKPIITTDDLSALWDLEVDLTNKLLPEIEDTCIKPAFQRFALLDKLHYARPMEGYEIELEVYMAPSRLIEVRDYCISMAETKTQVFVEELDNEKSRFKPVIEQLWARYHVHRMENDMKSRHKHAAMFEVLHEELVSALETMEQLLANIKVFDRDKTTVSESTKDAMEVVANVQKLKEFVSYYHSMWTIASDCTDSLESWMNGHFFSIDPDSVEAESKRWLSTLQDLIQNFDLKERNPDAVHVCFTLQKNLSTFYKHLPLMKLLRCKALKPRHWEQIVNTFQPESTRRAAASALRNQLRAAPTYNENTEASTEGSETLPTKVSFKELVNLNVHKAFVEIEKICKCAEREYEIELALNAMEEVLRGVWVKTAHSKMQGSVILFGATNNSQNSTPAEITALKGEDGTFKELDIILEILQEQLIRTRIIQASPFAKSGDMYERAKSWECMLQHVQEWLKSLGYFQESWFAVQSLFVDHTDETLPIRVEAKELKAFKLAEKLWQKCMYTIQKVDASVFMLGTKLEVGVETSKLDGSVVETEEKESLRPLPLKLVVGLIECIDEVTHLTRSYLGRHKEVCPQLYFLTDSQCLNLLLSNHNGEYDTVQKFLPLMYDGFDKVGLIWGDLSISSENGLNLMKSCKDLVVDDEDDPHELLCEAMYVKSIYGAESKTPEQPIMNFIGMGSRLVIAERLKNAVTNAVVTRRVSISKWLPELDKFMLKFVQKEIHAKVRSKTGWGMDGLLDWVLTGNEQSMLIATRVEKTQSIESCLNKSPLRISTKITPEGDDTILGTGSLYTKAPTSAVEYIWDMGRIAEVIEELDKELQTIAKVTSSSPGKLKQTRRVPLSRGELKKCFSFLQQIMSFRDIAGLLDEFTWNCTFRYYLNDEAVRVEAGQVVTPYGYNLSPSQERAVITPLTARCLRILIHAAKWGEIGTVSGDLSVGKKTTIREAALSIGAKCVMFQGGTPGSTTPAVFESWLNGVFKSPSCWGFLSPNLAPGNLLKMHMQDLFSFIRNREANREGGSQACGSAVFLSTSRGAHKSELPRSLARQLRTCCIIAPDITPFT